MKISYNWLKNFIKTDLEAEKTSALLTSLGLEVEGIIPFESVRGGLKGVVVGHVVECQKHPNADKLSLTKVDIGTGAPVQIVCGAPNVAKGQKVAVATIGTELYDADGNPWQIKKGKIRGEESNGMICAEDELGLGKSHDGIMVLSNDLVPGTPCSEVFKVEVDQVFEIGLTPNRADAMSHFGVARDLRAGLMQQGVSLELITPSVSNFHVNSRTLRIEVDVKDKELCPRYCGLTLSGLKVKESPEWLKNKLKAIGLTPKNNVVDVTNYVMHELGQPLHAFDAAKITGNKIIVKTMPAGTKFTTLDEIERELHQEDLMICDTEKPLCLAGVFGGSTSGVNLETTTVFLESAYFNPVSIRKSAKRHGLNTDASFRFERGIDINLTKYALQRAALLIKELAGGEISSDVEEFYPVKFADHQVFLTFEKINSLIGKKIPTDTIKSILSSLEIKINNATEAGLGLTIPSYRVDVQREVDVIEEILRVYGYDNIDFGSKINASVASTSRYDDHRIRRQISDTLVSFGYYEIMTNSLTSPRYAELLDGELPGKTVTLLNPLSGELSAMRQSMLFSGMEAVRFNLNRKSSNLKFFEFGKTYHHIDGERAEYKQLALWVSGNLYRETWNQQETEADFFYLKGVVDALLNRLGLEAKLFETFSNKSLSEGISYLSNKGEVVRIGRVNPRISKEMEIKEELYYAEFNWDLVLELLFKKRLKFREIPKFPEVRRDLALLLDENISFDQLKQAAIQTEKKLLQDIHLFDVYQGDKLPQGKKSYAISVILRDDQKTLTDAQIDKVMEKITRNLQQQCGAELRS